ncbi:uncharacterized protein [Miscanthus floridulus]|uniref:uncharacterized protein isoform X3 n=1 Tax=Miscanthus floridulus TaxID=154761 RepID=UPI00345ADA72
MPTSQRARHRPNRRRRSCAGVRASGTHGHTGRTRQAWCVVTCLPTPRLRMRSDHPRLAALFSHWLWACARDYEAGVRGHSHDRLPCCGIGFGWFLFIIGFFLGAIPWYIGALLLWCSRVDYREKPGYVACTVALELIYEL